MEKIIVIILFVFSLISCGDNSSQEFAENCPYERKYPPYHHQLVVPVDIIPHQKTYSVGDTMTIRSFFSDSIYDNNMQTHFKVKHFPFRPYKILYKFTDEGWEHGWRINELIVDEKYNPSYAPGSFRGDSSRGEMLYEEGYYHYEIKIVLETPGVYCTYMNDTFNGTPKDFEEARLAEVLEQTEFEEYCGFSFSHNTMIVSGDPHYDDFPEELIYLDEVIYFGGLNDLGNRLKNGNTAVEWTGVFLFEVVE